tara:strand:- start:86 stop:973 length:888 start_codon:yes stop_codon:yes gene_type:complete
MDFKEITDYLDTRKEQIKEGTAKTYLNTFKNIVELFKLTKNDKSYNLTSKKIKQTLENQDKFNKIDILKVLILLKEFKKKPTKHLNSYRQRLFNEKQIQSKQKMNDYLNDGLNYDDLTTILNKAYSEEKYIDFILFYLLIHINTRNTDLIILNKNELSVKELQDKYELEKDFNYFETKKDKIIYNRKQYKTKTKYGIKKDIITDERFITALNTLDKDDFIFKNRVNKPYNRDEMNQFINARFKKYNNKIKTINQQLIYKIVLKYYEDLNDNEKVKQLRNRRGHSASIQETYYSSK